jgi:hypothetical protein
VVVDGNGAITQLGECDTGSVEVVGSIPTSSTMGRIAKWKGTTKNGVCRAVMAPMQGRMEGS